MNELTNEDVKNFKEWSEGNRELFELLCWCRKCNVKTLASCGGHEFEDAEEHGVEPYIAMTLDGNFINYLKDVISELRDVEEIVMEEGLNTKDFIIRSDPSNCSEVFYKIKLAIIKHQMQERGDNFIEKKARSGYRSIKEQQLLKSAKKLESSYDDKIPYYKLDTRSKGYYEFRNGISWGRWFGTGITIPKKFMKLYEKYGKLQKKYEPTSLTCWEDIRTYIINNEYENPPVDLYVRPELEGEINQKVWDFVKQNLIEELKSRGIGFDVKYHDRSMDSSYYVNDEKIEDGIGRYIIDIPQGQEYSNSENPFNNIDLFEYVYNVFHEYKHVMQRKEYIYDAKDTDENRSFAKTEIISKYIPSYSEENYANDPRELDAQIYGIEQAIQYIKEKFPWVNTEQRCIEYIKDFAKSQKENRIQNIII